MEGLAVLEDTCGMVERAVLQRAASLRMKDIARFLTRLAFYSIPCILWLTLYKSSTAMPNHLRPCPDVTTLPRMERLLFGGVYPHRFLSSDVSLTKDILAGIVYAMHFFFPVFFLMWLLAFGGTLVYQFLWVFGVCNILGVMTQLLFPTAPPWYLDMYGMQPGDYNVVGDPAALSRLDDLLGFTFFQSLYGQSAVVFGSFPSLHCALPTLVAVFSSKVIGTAKPGICYTVWLGWAALYLRHHYFLDLCGGVLFAFVGYYSYNLNLFPRKFQLEKAQDTKDVRGPAEFDVVGVDDDQV